MADPGALPTRIDKGIKRGKRATIAQDAQSTTNPLTSPAPTQPAPSSQQSRAILADVNPADILDRYAQGETSDQISAAYQVNRRTMLGWLLAKSEGDWQQLQIVRAVDEYEQAKAALDSAPHALALARARERVRAAQWELERLWPKLYGQRQQIEHTVKRSLTEKLARAEARVIDVTPGDVPTVPAALPDSPPSDPDPGTE